VNRSTGLIGVLLVTVCCAHRRPEPPEPLTAAEAAVVGCYELVVLPWPGFGNSSSVFRLQLDSVGSVGARRLIDITQPHREYRDTSWSSSRPDSVDARLWVDQKLGYEFYLRVTRDSVSGEALQYLRQGEVRTRPVRGVREACPSRVS